LKEGRGECPELEGKAKGKVIGETFPKTRKKPDRRKKIQHRQKRNSEGKKRERKTYGAAYSKKRRKKAKGELAYTKKVYSFSAGYAQLCNFWGGVERQIEGGVSRKWESQSNIRLR